MSKEQEQTLASVLGELEDGTLASHAAGDGADISGVGDGNNDASSEEELLPGAGKVEDVDSVSTAGVDVLGHLGLAVLGAAVEDNHRRIAWVTWSPSTLTCSHTCF